MNIRLVLFSGIVTALVGSMLGLAAVQLGQHNFNQARFQSESYKNLYGKYALIGAGVGFAIGVGQQCVRELKTQQED